MYSNAVKLLCEAKNEISRAQLKDRSALINSEWGGELIERLDDLEPFRTIASSWVYDPMGGGRTGKGIAPYWAWKRLLESFEPEVIVEQVRNSVAENRYLAREVRPVKGVKVDTDHLIDDTVMLVPNDRLLRCAQFEQLFCERVMELVLQRDASALVQTVVVEPAFTSHRDQKIMDQYFRQRVLRDTVAAKLRLAMGLIGTGAVEIPAAYIEPNDNCLFWRGAALYSKITDLPFGNFAIDLAGLGQMLGRFEAMKSPKALELSIDRLLQSRLPGSIEDRVIDLGMAAEIALMHSNSNSDGKGEITEKIASRGAWLLGKTVEERSKVYNILRNLYGDRCKAVHTGQVSTQPPKVAKNFAEYDRIVREVLLAILSRGSFPNWKSLVMGGEG